MTLSVSSKQALDHLFHPESVAIVGVSTEGADWSPGPVYAEGLKLFGYRGRVYLVNRKGGEFEGTKLYASLLDLPESPDLVVCCIAAPSIPALIDDCIARRVGAMTIFTGGFRERNGEEGAVREEELRLRARGGGLRLLGPNCLGPYCPEAGLSPGADFPAESGPVGLICQSGGNFIHFIRLAAQRGVLLTKGISYGNACDVNECDLLEHMAADPAVRIMAMYIEGPRDGQRLFKLLRQTCQKKPVVILKGGRSEAGSLAATSHSGALATSQNTWDAMCRQTGAIQVNNIEEMIDAVVTLQYLPPLAGRRVGLVGQTGGATVLAADDCAAGGFILPRLSAEVRARLASLFRDDPGVMVDNPVDESIHGFTDGVYDALKVMQAADVDLLLVHIPIGLFLLPARFACEDSLRTLVGDVIRAHREGSKPVGVAIYAAIGAQTRAAVLKCQEDLHRAGVPVYNSVRGAARAIDRAIRYRQWLSGTGG